MSNEISFEDLTKDLYAEKIAIDGDYLLDKLIPMFDEIMTNKDVNDTLKDLLLTLLADYTIIHAVIGESDIDKGDLLSIIRYVEITKEEGDETVH